MKLMKIKDCILRLYYFRQRSYFKNCLNIVTDIISKSKGINVSAQTQTELSLTQLTAYRNLYSKPILSDNELRNYESPIYEFLNLHLKDVKKINLCSWQSVYEISESILNNKNRLINHSGSDNKEIIIENIHNACLLEFCTKFPESPEKSAFELYSYLNVLLM